MSKAHIIVYIEELNKEVEVLVNIQDVITEIGEEELLNEMNLDSQFCFSYFSDLETYVQANLHDFDVPLAEEYINFIQQNIHDRMVRFIDSNYYDNLSYEELDNYLTQKGF